jgi:hypothetical protein
MLSNVLEPIPIDPINTNHVGSQPLAFERHESIVTSDIENSLAGKAFLRELQPTELGFKEISRLMT